MRLSLFLPSPKNSFSDITLTKMFDETRKLEFSFKTNQGLYNGYTVQESIRTALKRLIW